MWPEFPERRWSEFSEPADLESPNHADLGRTGRLSHVAAVLGRSWRRYPTSVAQGCTDPSRMPVVVPLPVAGTSQFARHSSEGDSTVVVDGNGPVALKTLNQPSVWSGYGMRFQTTVPTTIAPITVPSKMRLCFSCANARQTMRVPSIAASILVVVTAHRFEWMNDGTVRILPLCKTRHLCQRSSNWPLPADAEWQSERPSGEAVAPPPGM